MYFDAVFMALFFVSYNKDMIAVFTNDLNDNVHDCKVLLMWVLHFVDVAL